MSKTSRRTILTAAAALVGGSTVNLAALAANGPTKLADDAELRALGVELDALIVEYWKRRAIDRAHRAAWNAACDRAGLPRREFEDFATRDDYIAYGDARSKVDAGDGYVDEDDEDGDSRVWKDIHNRMYALCDKIADIRAYTLAGLGVKARSISLEHEEMWGGDPEGVCDFIDSVCEFCGVRSFAMEETSAGRERAQHPVI